MPLTRMRLNGEELRKPSISYPGTYIKMRRTQLVKIGECKWFVERGGKVTMFDTSLCDRHLPID